MDFEERSLGGPDDDTHGMPCWKELLEGALAGLYPSDEELERMLDRLERMP